MNPIIIGGQKLVIGQCNKKGKSFSRSKSIFLNGIYYDFPKNKEFYPLELAIAQIDTLKKFDLVFFEDVKSEYILGVFIGSDRKTISIDKNNFYKQLIRYKETVGKIAIVNSVLEDIDFADIDNVDFIALEKLPILIDPNKKKIVVIKYFIFAMFFLLTSLITNYFNDEISRSLLINQQNLQNESNNTQKLLKEINTVPMLPNDNARTMSLEKILNDIEVGTK